VSFGVGVLVMAVLTMTSTTQSALANAGAGPTSALKTDALTDPCASDQLCLYEGKNYRGEVQAFGSQPADTCVDLSEQLKGNVSSISNKLATDVMLFAGDGCTAKSKKLYIGASYPDLGDRRILFDNQARSVKFLAPPGPCDPRSHNLCLYADADMQGEVQVEAIRPADTCVDVRQSLRGRVSSASNNLKKPVDEPGADRQAVLLFATDGCSGDPTSTCFLDSGVGYPDMSVQGFDNKTRSIKFQKFN
jgi:hypothetical protein